MNISRIFGKTEETQAITKRMLIGSLASSIAYYGNLYAMTDPAYPAELKNRLDNHLPQNGDMIGSVVPPVVLYVAKKVVKDTKRKEKVGDMALGSALFGFPNLVKTIGVQSAYQAGVDSKPTAGFSTAMNANNSKYAVSQNNTPRSVAQPSSVSKYVITG